MNEVNDLQPGQIVYLAAGTRHDTEVFLFAIITHDGQRVQGGGTRYEALLVDCIFNPTQFAWRHVYSDDEIAMISRCSPLSPETMAGLREKAGR